MRQSCVGVNYTDYSNVITLSADTNRLSGDTSVLGNCTSGDNATFRLLDGYTATVTPSGYYFSGTGTRYATGYLNDNNGNTIQTFTMTQVGSNSATFSPSSYTITSGGTYQLIVNQLNCGGTDGSGTMGLSVS
jgi:hypothetical protein